MTPTLRLSVKDEMSGRDVVLFIDRDVPLVVVRRTLARCGVSIGKHQLKALMEQAMTVDGGGVH